MGACIILHNMIVKNERDICGTSFGTLPSYDDKTNVMPQPNLGEEIFEPYKNYIENNIQIRDRQNVNCRLIWWSIPHNWYPLNYLKFYVFIYNYIIRVKFF